MIRKDHLTGEELATLRPGTPIRISTAAGVVVVEQVAQAVLDLQWTRLLFSLSWHCSLTDKRNWKRCLPKVLLSSWLRSPSSALYGSVYVYLNMSRSSEITWVRHAHVQKKKCGARWFRKLISHPTKQYTVFSASDCK